MTRHEQNQVAPVTKIQPKIQADQVILNTRSGHEEVLKGTAKAASCWRHSPCMFKLNRAADLRLTKADRLLGSNANQVDKVRAALSKTGKQIYIWPADHEDLEAITVNRVGTSAWINLWDLLAPEKITMETGYRERHAVQFAPSDGLVTPAIMIDLEKPLERKPERRKSRAKSAAKSTKSAASAKAPEATPAKPAEPAADDKQA